MRYSGRVCLYYEDDDIDNDNNNNNNNSNSCYFAARSLGPLMLRCPWSETCGRQPTPPTVPPVQQQPNSQHGTEPSLL